jgi:hypothetical protein
MVIGLPSNAEKNSRKAELDREKGEALDCFEIKWISASIGER